MSLFVPLMGYDVISLGNHEFDDGVAGLAPFLNAAKAANLPVVAANVDITKEPRLGNLSKSVVIERNGHKIGVIGYLTPDTETLSTPGKTVRFQDEIDAIRREVKELEAQNIDILIALGHSGYARDKEIAAAIPQLDLVVGGHTNTFLWNGPNPPSSEKPLGSYPTVITHAKPYHQTLVVQAHAYGKYLGKLDLEFDEKGRVVAFGGNPIYIDSIVPETTSNGIKRFVDSYNEEISGKMSQVIGRSSVQLEGGAVACRTRECSVGNMITDSYVFGFMEISKSQDYTKGWTKYPIAVTSSGDIRTQIDLSESGNITLSDVMSVIPFGNTIEVVTISGKVLKEMFEHSISKFDPSEEHLEGRFLQVSGIRVTYDWTQPVGSRVLELKARCGSDCLVPRYDRVDDHKNYTIISTNYLLDGGDGYSMVVEKGFKRKNFEQLDLDLVQNYLKYRSPVTVGAEDRINIIETSSSLSCHASSNALTLALILVLQQLIRS